MLLNKKSTEVPKVINRENILMIIGVRLYKSGKTHKEVISQLRKYNKLSDQKLQDKFMEYF